MSNGKIDAFIYDMPLTLQHGYSAARARCITLTPRLPMSRLPGPLRKGDYDFINWLNNFMIQVKNDGTYDKIYGKWFEDDSWMKEIQ